MPLTALREAHLARLLTSDADRYPDIHPAHPIVIDTNVLLDRFHWRDPGVTVLERLLAEGRFRPVRDEATLRELAEVLDRPAFGRTFDEVSGFLEAWCREARPIPEEAVRSAETELEARRILCRDPLDQKFLALAEAARAEVLVTKDKLVLKAGKKLRRRGVLTLTPEGLEALPG